ncbi:hypothetical protein [Candidatus Mycolicibacterium alkanivorans]|uniref:SHOCT domain-containing protein n=1 Tax=Candidatus Mycolicibacterium alkanivorans TaxID=2954114 RepID=A0ABS9YS58_9MYCO|nr:hypothetical protein [Candidatus Mycolicibacterium alkanivorans]MCI4674071.1 hypothetical protein [Candidatus Mycolicibacterium alkanivorans]
MWWCNGSWGHAWWPVIMLMGVFTVIWLAMMARTMSHAMPRSHTGESERHGPDMHQRILAHRLGSGDIDIDEYERLRDALQRRADAART